MPAPKLNLNDLVVARDGSKGSIIVTHDRGESGLPSYTVRLENGNEVEIAESELAVAPAAAPTPTKKAVVDGPSQTASEGDQGSAN